MARKSFDSGIRRTLFCPVLVLMLMGFGCGGGSNGVITTSMTATPIKNLIVVIRAVR